MTNVAEFRWGLVGASDIADTRVLPAIRALGQQVVGVVSGAGAHATQFASKNDIPLVTASLSELLNRDDVDGVYISSVNEKHQEQVDAAARAGKHILCEKPLSVDLTSARSMIEACHDGSVVLAVNHHLPAMGTHRALKALIAEGAIGRPLTVAVRHAGRLPDHLAGWRLSDGVGSGVVLDISTHDASAVEAFLGTPAVDVAAMTRAHGARPTLSADSSLAVVSYGDDVLASFHDSYSTPFTRSLVEVHGTDGSIRAPEIMTPDPVGEVFVRDSRGEHHIQIADRGDAYQRTIERFVRTTEGEGTPVVDGNAAMRALAVGLAINESARTGQRVQV